MLPPELLVQIFEYAHDWQRRPIGQNSEPTTTTLLSIIPVCKGWRSLAEPLLYRQISLDYEPHCTKSIRHEQIRDSLRQGPYRYGFVEDLLFTYSNKTGMECDKEILETIRKMSNLRTIQLVFTWGKPPIDCAITEKLSSLPKLESVSSSGSWTGSILSRVLNSKPDDVFPALKRLDICDAEPVGAGRRLPTVSQYTSKIESLYVHYDCHPYTLYELLKWPHALKKLVIDVRFDRCRYASLYTTDRIQRMLNVQSRNLQEIYLPGYTHDTEIVLPDFTRFSSLIVLELNQYEVFQNRPRTAAERLCTPSLETFKINMDPEDQQVRGYVQFEDTHANWLADFAMSYHDLSQTGSLKVIHIHFCWIDEFTWYQQPFDRPWPNACLAALRPKIAENGINLTWPRPALTEEEWFGPDRRRRCSEWMGRSRSADRSEQIM